MPPLHIWLTSWALAHSPHAPSSSHYRYALPPHLSSSTHNCRRDIRLRRRKHATGYSLYILLGSNYPPMRALQRSWIPGHLKHTGPVPISTTFSMCPTTQLPRSGPIHQDAVGIEIGISPLADESATQCGAVHVLLILFDVHPSLSGHSAGRHRVWPQHLRIQVLEQLHNSPIQRVFVAPQRQPRNLRDVPPRHAVLLERRAQAQLLHQPAASAPARQRQLPNADAEKGNATTRRTGRCARRARARRPPRSPWAVLRCGAARLRATPCLRRTRCPP